MSHTKPSDTTKENRSFIKEVALLDKLKICISPIEEVSEEEWTQLLNQTAESTYFCTTNWWNVFENSYALQVRDGSGRLVGGVPFRIVSVLPIIGKFFRISWLDSSVLVTDNYSQAQVLDIKRAAFKYLIKYFDKVNVIAMTISSKSQSMDKELFRELFNSSEKCATFIVDLSRDEEDIFKAFEKRKRRSIRKARQAGVEIKILEEGAGLALIHDYCLLQNKMFEHKSNSYSNIYAKSEEHLKSILSPKQKAIIAIAYYEGEPVVGNILVSHKKTVHAYLGASDNLLNRATNASTLLEYECMLYAKHQGYVNYDLGGIPVQVPDKTDGLYGVYFYKKGFGGERFVFDSVVHKLHRYKYHFIWWLRKFENNSVARKVYNFLQRNKHAT